MHSQKTITERIDDIVMHSVWGIPIFFFVMFLVFEATFSLGVYPMEWIESGVKMLSKWVEAMMDNGVLRNLVVDGVLGGVGSVIVFLPNILILYLLISIMEESGYMARAALIMDNTMQRVGLHGKSFIPLVMGFGCNVPAIVAAGGIENRSSRIITIFIIPFMSCSARLPIYILLAGTLFPQSSGLIMFGLYFLGILLAVITSLVMRRVLFHGVRESFDVELVPYKLPSMSHSFSLMWDKSWQYIRKMGTLILVASIAVWFLSYYPRNEAYSEAEQQQNSYMGRIGKFCEPVMKPLGLEWRANVSLISGIAAKELIVSTLGVLYGELDYQGEPTNLSTKLTAVNPATGKSDFSPASALSFMVFVLLYFPCIASLAAMASQIGSWRWTFAALVYYTALAWVFAFLTYQIGGFII